MSRDEPRPPRPLALLNEASAFLEFPRLLWHLPGMSELPRGNGEPVLVLPGLSADDASTFVLRRFLRSRGYHTRGWRLGRNRGRVRSYVRQMIESVEQRAQETGKSVRLVGWSLGGVVAREVARERPAIVERVVTMGSPVLAGPKGTFAENYYRRRGFDVDAFEREIAARNEVPIQTPVTAIFSRRDAIVSWRACIDESNPNVHHVEVTTSHLGLGLNAEVFRVVARALDPALPPIEASRSATPW